MATNPLKIARLQRRRAHLRRLRATVGRVADVRRAVTLVQTMVRDGDFNGALDIIYTTLEVLALHKKGVGSITVA